MEAITFMAEEMQAGPDPIWADCCHLAYQVDHVAARWMDTRFSTHKGFLIQRLYLQKGIRTGCPDAPSDGFVSHGEGEEYKSVGLLLGNKRLPGGIPFFFV